MGSRLANLGLVYCLLSMSLFARALSGSWKQVVQTSHWGAWGAWGQCSATCGQGLQVNERVCDATVAVVPWHGESQSCHGIDRETRSCTSEDCISML